MESFLPQDAYLYLEDFMTNMEFLYSLAFVIVTCLIAQYRLHWRDFPLAGKRASSEQVEETGKLSAIQTQEKEGTGVSIVIPVEADDGSLKDQLLALLSQACEARYEVIVVDERPDGTVERLVKAMQKSDSRLRYTYVPTTTRYIELRKLSLTLGIRAARAPWVIILSSSASPKDEGWLQNFYKHLRPDYDFVSAYVNYQDDGSSQARRCIYERLQTQLLRMRAFKCHRILGTEHANYALRKEWFLEHEGFADSLLLPMGEESLLVNRHASPERSLALLDYDTAVTEKLPERQEQRLLRAGQSAAAIHLHKGATLFRWRSAWAYVFFGLFVLSSPVYAALRFFHDWPLQHYNSAAALPDGLVIVSLITFLVLPPLLLMKSTKQLNERSFVFYIYVHAALHPFRKISLYVSRRDLVRHFIRRHQTVGRE